MTYEQIKETYQKFKSDWLGKGINYDGAYGNQCMDVYRMWCKYLGFPQSPGVAGAKNVWTTFLKDNFNAETNNPSDSTQMPKMGDVVIWGMGTYGHIAVCESATGTSVTSFEQNWTEGGTAKDGKGVAEVRVHNYNNIIGWLTPKVTSLENDMVLTQDQQNIINFLAEQGMNEGKVREAIGALQEKPNYINSINDLNTKIKALIDNQEENKKIIEELRKKIDEISAINTDIQKLASDWQSKCSTANEQLYLKSQELAESQKKELELKQKITELTSESAKDLTLGKFLQLIIKRFFGKS